MSLQIKALVHALKITQKGTILHASHVLWLFDEVGRI